MKLTPRLVLTGGLVLLLFAAAASGVVVLLVLALGHLSALQAYDHAQSNGVTAGLLTRLNVAVRVLAVHSPILKNIAHVDTVVHRQLMHVIAILHRIRRG
jgi:hypothetical protein